MKELVTTVALPPCRDALSRALLSLLDSQGWHSLRILYAVDELDEALSLQSAIHAEDPERVISLEGLPVSTFAAADRLAESVCQVLEATSPDEMTVAVAPAFSSLGSALWNAGLEMPSLFEFWVGSVCDDHIRFNLVEIGSQRMFKEPGVRYVARVGQEDATPQQVADRLGLLGQSPGLKQAVADAGTLAKHKVPILVTGETGTGKGVLARLIHECSPSREGPFVAINCAALPETLVESILFGHAKGSFTGATRDQAGKFEQAHGGTLFLDEIGELPLALQPKLLKVLDDGSVERIGSDKTIPVDVRVIAATHVDLAEAVAVGDFREDLFYRISYGVVTLPPLRDRKDDLGLLAIGLLKGINQQVVEPKRLSEEAEAWLAQQDWPGNVRDLQSVLGRAAFLTEGAVLGLADLQRHASQLPRSSVQNSTATPYPGFSLERHLAGVRETLMEKALVLANGNQSLAARLLGLTPQAVHKYVKSRDAS